MTGSMTMIMVIVSSCDILVLQMGVHCAMRVELWEQCLSFDDMRTLNVQRWNTREHE